MATGREISVINYRPMNLGFQNDVEFPVFSKWKSMRPLSQSRTLFTARWCLWGMVQEWCKTEKKTRNRFTINLLLFDRWGAATEECLATQRTKIIWPGKEFHGATFSTCVSTSTTLSIWRLIRVIESLQPHSAFS